MVQLNTFLCSTLTAIVLCVPCLAKAEGVQTIENFETYESGIGDWAVSGTSNISASLGLNVTGAIEGTKDLKQTLGAGLLNSSFTVQNLNLDVPVPVAAQNFEFAMSSLLTVNLSRKVKVTLRDESNVEHESPAISLATVGVGATNISTALASMSPPLAGGPAKRIKGVKLTFTSSVLSLAAAEHIDNLRLTWDNSSVPDWSFY